MKTDHKILLGLLAIVVLGVGFVVFQFTKENQQAFGTKSTGSTNQGDVLIELTPALNNGRLEVKIAANTHSVDLSQFELKEITTLQTNKNTLKPISAPKISGHHATGIIVFEVNKKEIEKGFTVTILGIPVVEERIFIW